MLMTAHVQEAKCRHSDDFRAYNGVDSTLSGKPNSFDALACGRSKEAKTSSVAKRATDCGSLRLWELGQLSDVVEQPLSAARELAQNADADLAAALWCSESALSSWVDRAASVIHFGIRSAEEVEHSLLAPLEVSDVHRCNRRVANLLAPSLRQINHLKKEVDDVTGEFDALRGHMEYLIQCARAQEMEWTMLLSGTIDGSACKSLPLKEWKTCQKAVIYLLKQSKQAMDPSTHFWRGMIEDFANLQELSKLADVLTIEAVCGASNEVSFAGQSEFIKQLRTFCKQFGRHHGSTVR
jgi:hypothetical protein